MSHWRSLAACRKMATSLFFAERGETISPEAEAACAGCVVASECLADALERDDAGYRAGTSHKQRRKMRRSGGMAPTVACAGCGVAVVRGPGRPVGSRAWCGGPECRRTENREGARRRRRLGRAS